MPSYEGRKADQLLKLKLERSVIPFPSQSFHHSSSSSSPSLPLLLLLAYPPTKAESAPPAVDGDDVVDEDGSDDGSTDGEASPAFALPFSVKDGQLR